MIFEAYQTAHPLTKFDYSRKDVEKIREHAFNAGKPDRKETRSQKQNRYYWGCVLKTISLDTGYLPDEIHQLMQKQFLAYENLGEHFVKSTTKLTTKLMEEYLENVRRFASMELSIYVALPNESDNYFYDLVS